MKRFYCKICDRVKRVQRWPYVVDNAASINVLDRVGECNWHNGGMRIPVTVGKSYIRKTKIVAQVKTRKRA